MSLLHNLPTFLRGPCQKEHRTPSLLGSLAYSLDRYVKEDSIDDPPLLAAVFFAPRR